jgi:hypothetical protein
MARVALEADELQAGVDLSGDEIDAVTRVLAAAGAD